ncbi:MAG: transposase [bacterium]
MPRPPRPPIAGGTFHVTARGNNDDFVFLDDYDRYAYLGLLAKIKREMLLTLFAYALMSTHLHIVFQTPDGNLSAAIHRLHGNYAKAFNRRYGRRGHLFENRFRSKTIEDDIHLLESTRYVHLNPVRAGMVPAPQDYPWTSYRYYVEPKSDRSLIDTDPVLALFSNDNLASRRAYARFVDDGIRADRLVR